MAETGDMGLAGEEGAWRLVLGAWREDVFAEGGERRGGILLAGLRTDGRTEHVVEEVRVLRRDDRMSAQSRHSAPTSFLASSPNYHDCYPTILPHTFKQHRTVRFENPANSVSMRPNQQSHIATRSLSQMLR